MYEIEESNYYVNLNRVMELFLKGTTNPTAIARTLGLQRKEVVDYINAWKETAKNDRNVKDRAAEALSAMDRHYDMIIKGLWEIADDPITDAKTRATTLKSLADIESKRQETLQKAGLYSDNDIADELLAMEQYVEGIKNALRATIKEYPMTKNFIMEQLSNAGDSQPVDSNIKIIEGHVVEDDEK